MTYYTVPAEVLEDRDEVVAWARKSVAAALAKETDGGRVMALLGNYYGTPSAPVTVLQGIRSLVGPKTKVFSCTSGKCHRPNGVP